MAKPKMIFPATAGNTRPLSILYAGGAAVHQLDLTEKIEGQVTITVNSGSAVSSMRGLRCLFEPKYLAPGKPSSTSVPAYAYDFPILAANVWENKTFYIGTGYWDLRLINLDTIYDLTGVEVTLVSVSEIA